jgi:hypothetical protein
MCSLRQEGRAESVFRTRLLIRLGQAICLPIFSPIGYREPTTLNTELAPAGNEF